MALTTVHHGPRPGHGDVPGRDDVAPSESGRHRRTKRRANRRLVGVIVVAAIAAVGIVACVAWVSLDLHPGSAGVSTSAGAGDADAAEWIRSNIPADARFLTDGHQAPSGYSGSPIDRPDQDWHTFDYLLTSPGVDPPPDASVAAVWQSSLAVAVFPAVQVRRILQTPLAEELRTREADRADRLVAGTALLSNPTITASSHAQSVLAVGGLDLRAAATLTALAGSTPVYVAIVEDVATESAAGMPARSMTVHVDDAAKADTVITGMTAAFRAEDVVATPEGTFRLHWPLRFNPLPSVN